jgi:hypothetical protein
MMRKRYQVALRHTLAILTRGLRNGTKGSSRSPSDQNINKVVVGHSEVDLTQPFGDLPYRSHPLESLNGSFAVSGGSRCVWRDGH